MQIAISRLGKVYVNFVYITTELSEILTGFNFEKFILS